MNVQVLNDGFTAAEVKLCIKSETGRSVASRTIRRWRQKLDIHPCEFGTYTGKQLDALVSLAGWLRSGRNINHFIDVHFDLLKEI
ncbi:hypothetical protein N836_31455 [Leptolyngbya sp. Heron Island J]|uniref:hypothetical protein n=1 Tax=Leptolyngbya sp. Heron Island J TaxID=1385935 RepID=UPI0003B95E6D|nr:hypothetical protein [Leptolyngbya sp. Heron Island J]ESA38459.1 hypothetical protein N836_31455 [Leptolyngbya sp. Heron Island J]